MVNHMHVRSFFPEAYDGKIGDYTITEIATSKELPAILKRFGIWVVTTQGIDCLKFPYPIAKDRLKKMDWVDHMREKSWFKADPQIESDFISALSTAEDFVRLEII